MWHPLIRRIFVLLLAVLMTAGMDLSVAYASVMKMTDMGAAMATAGMTKCDDCGTSGESKGMTGCMAPACTAQVAATAPSIVLQDLAFVPIRHHFQTSTLFGRDAVPDPYPPRTCDIG